MRRLALALALLVACEPSEPVEGVRDAGIIAPRVDGARDTRVGDAAGDALAVDASAEVEGGATDAVTAAFDADAAPIEALSINSIVPNRGDARGGASVRIVGTGFTPRTAFFLGDVACEGVEIINPNRAQCTAPAQPIGVVELRAVDPELDRVFALEGAFTYFQALSITHISPDRGQVEGGVPILIEGAGLIEGTEARIGGLRLLGVTYTEGGLMGELPPGEFGPKDVRVMNPNGSATIPDGFFYYEPLRLDAVDPAASPVEGGVVARVRGAGLVAEGSVTLGALEAEILGADEARRWVEIRAPGQPAGVVDVSVSNPNGEGALPNGFLYFEAAEGLSVSGIVPAQGSTLGGEAVLIGGAGFDEGVEVRFEGRVLPCERLDAHRIECVTPPGELGVARVFVSDGASEVEIPGGYAYINALRLTSVTPEAAAVCGGALVTVEGQGFDAETAIYLGDQPLGDLEYVDETRLRGIAPAHPAGAVDVRAEGAASASRIEGGFLYFDPASRFGGLWGEAIRGAVNVTVRNAAGGDPLEGAAVLCLSDDGRFELEGIANADGQLTLSALGLRGPLSLSAALEGFAVTTVEGVGVENVTVYLEPNDGEDGAPPSGDLLAQLSGTISGLDRLPKPREEGRVNIVVVETTHTNPYNRSRLPDPGVGGLLTEDGPFSIAARAGELALIVTAGEIDRAYKDAYLAGELPWGAMRRQMTPLAMGIRRFISASPGLSLEGLHVEVDHMMDQTLIVDLDNPPLGAEPGPMYYAVLPRLELGAEGYWELDMTGFGLVPSVNLERTPSLSGWDPDIQFYLIGFAFSATADNRPYAVSLARTRDVEGGVFITPFVGTPRIITPDGLLGPGRRVEWTMDMGFYADTPPPSAYLIEILEPTLGPPRLLWRYIAPPDMTSLEIPALPRAAGATGLGQGVMILEILPFIYDGGLDFDRFTYDHLSQLDWASWAEARATFMQ